MTPDLAARLSSWWRSPRWPLVSADTRSAAPAVMRPGVGLAAVLSLLGAAALVWALTPTTEQTPRLLDASLGAVALFLAVVAASRLVSARMPLLEALSAVAAALIAAVVLTRPSPQGQVTLGSLMVLLAVQAATFIGGPWLAGHTVAYGALYWVALVRNPVFLPPLYPVVVMATLVVAAWLVGRLVAQLAALLDQVERAAERDPLTGALNRRGLDQRLRGHGEPGGPDRQRFLVVIDLDAFKQYNDERGHLAGDALLTDLTRTWGGAIRADDLLARIGGDEFLLVLHAVDLPAATRSLDRLRGLHPQPWSAGIVPWPPDEPLEGALARADAAMYADKRSRGRLRDQVDPGD